MDYRRTLLVVLALLVTGWSHVRAAGTTPALVLETASGAAIAGARAVVFTGSFDLLNQIQVGYPLDLVVFQGTRFVRYRLAAESVSGVSDTLADGQLLAPEIPALLSAGTPTPPSVRVLTLRAAEVRVTLPDTFTAGATSALLIASIPDGPVLSNPITFVLP